MFYRIRQSFSTNFKKKNLQVFFFFCGFFFLPTHPLIFFVCVFLSPPLPRPPHQPCFHWLCFGHLRGFGVRTVGVSPVPLVAVVVPVVSVSVLVVVLPLKIKKKTQTKNPHIYWLNRYLGEHKPLPCCSLLIIKGEKNQKTHYLPVVLPVVIPVSVVVVVATVKSVVVASVAVIEVTVTLGGGAENRARRGGGCHREGKAAPLSHLFWVPMSLPS